MSLPLDKNTAVIVQRNNVGTAFVERYISGSNLYLQTDSTGSIVGSSTFPTLSSLSVTTLSASYVTASNFFDASKGYDSFTSLYRESKVVPNIAALQALTGSFLTGSTFVQGYFSPGDGGGGYYNWIPNDTTMIDSGSSLGDSGGAPGRWKLDHRGEVSVAQFGAIGQDSHQDTYIQNLVDAVKTGSLKVGRMVFENGKQYTLSSSIDFVKTSWGPSGYLTASQFWEFEICSRGGRGIGGNGNVSVPKISLSFSDGPAFVFQLAKGIIIDGLEFQGPNVPTVSLSDFNNIPFSASYLKDANQRTNQYSPQAAIAIDAFNKNLSSTNSYPQAKFQNNGVRYASAFGIQSGGGSGRILIKNCFFRYWVVGVAVGCCNNGSGPQNGEEIIISDCHFATLMDATAWGQSQTRACTIRDCLMTEVRTIVDCQSYGVSQGSMPNIIGGSWNNIQTAFRANTTWGGAAVTGVYAELLYTLGVLGNAAMGDIPIVFTGCHFDFVNGNYFPQYHINAIQGVIKFVGCTLQQLGQSSFSPIVILVADQNEKQADVIFDSSICYNPQTGANSDLCEFPFVSNNIRKLKFNNCILNSRHVLSENQHFRSWNYANLSFAPYGTSFYVDNKKYRIGSDIITINTGGGSSGSLYRANSTSNMSSSIELWVAGNIKSGSFRPNDCLFKGGNATFYSTPNQTGWGYIDMYVGTVVGVGGANLTNLTCSLTSSTDSPPGIDRVGALIVRHIPHVISGSLSGSVEEYAAGTVVTRSVAMASTYVQRTPTLHIPIIGDITNGSQLVTNISQLTASSANPPGVFNVGDRIRGRGLVEGCWVMAISASTYTLSLPATATISGNKLYDAYIMPVDLDVKNYLSASVATTLGTNEHYINCAVPGLTHTLPTGSSVPIGKEYIIKDTSNSASISAITIARTGTDTIDGQAASYKMRTDLGELRFLYNGYGNWIVGGNRIASSSLATTASYAVLAGNANTADTASVASSSLSSSWAATASYAGSGLFSNGGNAFGSTAVIGTSDSRSFDINTTNTQRWTVVSSSGTLEGSGSKIIQTTMGDLTLRSIGGSGSINLTPNGNGDVNITQGNLSFSKWGSGNPRQAIEGAYISTANNSGGTTSNTIMDNVFSRLRGAGARYTISSSGIVGYNDQIFEEPKEGIFATVNSGNTGSITVDFNPYAGYVAGDSNGYTYPRGDILINYYDDPTSQHDVLVEHYRPSASVDIWETSDTQTNVSSGGYTTLTIPASFNYIKGLRFTFLNYGGSNLRVTGISYLPQRAAETDMVCFPRYTHTTVDVCNGSMNVRDNSWITRTTLNPKVTNSSNAVGYMFDTANTMSISGAKIMSIKTAGNERWAVYGSGVLEASGSQTIQSTGTLTIGTTNSSSINISPNGTGSVNITSPMIMSVGKSMTFATGSNQRAGNTVLVGGTKTVSNTTITTNTIIMLTRKIANGVIGNLSYTLSNGVSFTINSDNASDTSTISYLLIENS